MATDSRALPAYFNTDTDFRNWCIGINAALVAAGWSVTSDTGQINTATVAKPAAASTSQGYEIWKDPTNVIYLKLEYGSAATAADRPAIWYTVGTGSNGSGTLTGQVGTRQTVGAAASKTAGATLTTYTCGKSDGGLIIVINYDNTNDSFGFMFGVDKTRNGAGATTADGIITFSNSGTASAGRAQVIPLSGTIPAALSASASSNTIDGPLTINNAAKAGGASVLGTKVCLYPYMAPLGELFFSLMAAVHVAADITSDTTFAATNLGGSHTYRALEFTLSSSIMGTASMSLSMLWE